MARSLLSLPTRTPMRIAYVSSSSMRDAVAEAIGETRPDVIYVERWRALQYVPAGTAIPVVCDPTDSMALYNYRLTSAGRPWERALGFAEYLKFRRFEAALACRVAATVFCSRADLDYLRPSAPDANLVQVPNGVDCELFRSKQPEEEQPNNVFFCGNFRYSPNRHAVRYFLKDIFPLVRQAVPKATFTMVGNGAGKFMGGKSARIPGIRVFDFAPQLRPHLARATVAVAPIRVGAGVSNKLLEAFAVGTPIVATSMACGDLPCRDGEHLFIADDPKRFAERVVHLLNQPNLRRNMAARAQVFVRRAYDWGIVARSMEDVLHQAAFGRGKEPETAVAGERIARKRAFATAAG